MRVQAKDASSPLVDIDVEECAQLPDDSVFSSLEECSAFFEAGCIGYSSRPGSCVMDGLKLQVDEWKVTPLKVHQARSSYYDDSELFPSGSIELDHALLMRDIKHEWHSEPEMRATHSTQPGL